MKGSRWIGSTAWCRTGAFQKNKIQHLANETLPAHFFYLDTIMEESEIDVGSCGKDLESEHDLSKNDQLCLKSREVTTLISASVNTSNSPQTSEYFCIRKVSRPAELESSCMKKIGFGKPSRVFPLPPPKRFYRRFWKSLVCRLIEIDSSSLSWRYEP